MVRYKEELKGFGPLIVESFRHINFKGKLYKRRLRLSRFNCQMIDKAIGTSLSKQLTRFVVLDLEDIKKACIYLDIEYKSMGTYFDIDENICSFSKVPTNIFYFLC